MSNPVQLDDVWTERILGSLEGMEYGSVQIIVHDGKIVQIERTERKRFDAFAQLQTRARPETLKKRSQ
ncbi:YezD family protein [Paenibacillus oceani]|uniref:YezD family protein n=1 Tax=Paenibacillus oceani TaxID=2772510 RepID=A0A927CBY0_9BACL|nr:YezD family protein [Paenibacillus oceani]MBD2863171.1 YezD family protein [Paenibacillus oceani]